MSKEDRPDFILDMARNCVAFRTRLINRVVTAVYDDALRCLGVRAGQINILVGLSLFGPSRPLDISRILRMDPSTVSRNVERMEKKGWLESVAGEDGRSRKIGVTRAGVGILERAYPAWRDAQEKASSILGPDVVAAVRELGDKLFGLDLGTE